MTRITSSRQAGCAVYAALCRFHLYPRVTARVLMLASPIRIFVVVEAHVEEEVAEACRRAAPGCLVVFQGRPAPTPSPAQGSRLLGLLHRVLHNETAEREVA
jgi:hypothetical protein